MTQSQKEAIAANDKPNAPATIIRHLNALKQLLKYVKSRKFFIGISTANMMSLDERLKDVEHELKPLNKFR